ncbi:hypothetical protein [Streptomyces sp. NPDC060194]|uniref:hypothetical protein n=1 Tax=Streptomyces sp. NPDC060194 TaxID=3347069 RepID=UPI003666B324
MKITKVLVPAALAVALLSAVAPAASAEEPAPPTGVTMAQTYHSTLDISDVEPTSPDELTPRERETLAAVLPFVASLFS